MTDHSQQPARRHDFPEYRVASFVLLLLLISAIILYFIVHDRYRDYYHSQQTLGKQSVASTIFEIQRYIREQRHLADLFARVERQDILALAGHPGDAGQHDRLLRKLNPYLPEAHNFTIANLKGVPLLPDKGKKLGKGCLKDIRNYAHGNKTNTVFVHSNPLPTEYHFDVLSDVDIGEDFQGIFFISINTRVLSRFLENFQLPGHQLVLTRPKKGKTLIELTSDGPRPMLKRSLHLGEDEIGNALYHEKIPGTYWTLYDIPKPGFLGKKHQSLLTQAIVLWLVFVFLCLLMVRQIILEKQERKKLDQQLHQANQSLQDMVETRTRALRETEAGFREVLENSTDILYKFNLKTRHFDYVSPAVRKILGVSEQTLIEEGADYFLALLHPDEKARISALLFGPFDNGDTEETHHSVVFQMKDRQQQFRWLSDNRHIIRDEHGKPVYIIGSIRDISESRKQAQLLSQSQKMEAIGKLTGGIAHDFNNILGIILGSIELLETQADDEEKTRQRAYTIKKAAERAADLTRKLLTFSRYQPDDLCTVDINTIIRDMDHLITRAITPQIEIEYQLSDELWEVNITPGDFEDILVNLVINARDAMNNQGSLTIETNNIHLDEEYCSLHPEARPGDYVELVVSDNGEGMTAEQIEHIYEPFYTTKEEGKGTGLGLSAVYGFIEHLDGHIKVYSEIGIGTTFRLFIPRSTENREPGKESPCPAIDLPNGTETLLIVDDEEDLLELARLTLESLGYRVITAGNGKDALAMLDKHPDIALMFSDVVMPGGLNGYELAEQAEHKRPDLKIILTSGYSKKAIARNGQARFDTTLLSKPYTQNDMVRHIRHCLDHD